MKTTHNATKIVATKLRPLSSRVEKPRKRWRSAK